ncbi:MAG: orotidine-5'-phosphate decarboxylase [Actinobacteria bacterium]|nr:orotidine-5'-phosphate decarboxylase [Actinomycetota bacterium]
MSEAVANPLIVALDVPELDEAVELASALAGEVGHFKVGLELFGGHGPAAVERIAEFGPVFLDLKLHDIPTTVERAARRLARLGIAMLTVHATGGRAMVASAVEGFAAGGGAADAILAVTVLTSMSDEDLALVNMPPAETQVESLAFLAVDAGAPGLVCAPRDLGRVRQVVGRDVILVTPGVRPAGEGDDDHARAATPSEALSAGATHLVVGRPITRADDPAAAARSILRGLPEDGEG